jgi:hypothetical protein
VAILGVLFCGWSSGMILLSFWAETAIIGFFTVLKMVKAEKFGKPPKSLKFNGKALDAKKMGRWGITLFFLFHFGGFMSVHLLFLAVLVFIKDTNLSDPFLILRRVAVFSVILFFSHGLSYWLNYLRAGEYRQAELTKLFMEPYKRVIPMHFTIIIGFVTFPGVLLIILKTIVDLWSHFSEHRKYHN